MMHQHSTSARGGAGLDELTPVQQRILLAVRGWHIFPLAPGRKIPYPGTRGFKDATTDLDAAQDWPTGAGVGIATGASGLLVIDCDNHGGTPPRPWNVPGVHNGEDALALLWSVHDLDSSPWAECPTVLTPSGGVHLYYRARSGAVASSAGRLAWQVDVRAQGGYVVAPGTVLDDGGTYTATHWPQAVPTAPQWVEDALQHRPEPARTAAPYRGPSSSPRAVQGILRTVAEAPAGKRNDTLNWGAWKLAEKGAATDENLDALAAAARHAGLNDREITRTLQSALTARGAAA